MHSTLDWSKWGYLGRLDSVIPGDGIEDYAYSGEWVRDVEGGDSESRLLFANGGNWATAVDFKNDHAYRERFLADSVPAAPYVFFENPDVLNVGVWGGAATASESAMTNVRVELRGNDFFKSIMSDSVWRKLARTRSSGA
jgi:hypothetical protein